jgi:hypothetical protein
MNLLQWPDTCSFTFKPSKKKQKWKNGKETGNVLYDFVYSESFETLDEKVARRTIEMMAEAINRVGFKLSRVGKRGLKISGTAEREVIAGMIVGEFFNHSPMGRLKLGELFQAATIGAFHAENVRHEEALKSAPWPPSKKP